MKNIVYTLLLLTLAMFGCKKTTGLAEKNTVTPNKVSDSLFEIKANYEMKNGGLPRYLPHTVSAKNTSIFADSSFWCFIKNGKYIVVSRARDFEYTYTTTSVDTLVLIVKNKAGKADTNNVKKIITKSEADKHILTVLLEPIGARITEATIVSLPLVSATKVFVAVYHNGNRIDNFIRNNIGESWEYSTVRSIVSTTTITNSQLPYKLSFPVTGAPFKLNSVNDIYTFKFYDTDINGALIDEATIKLKDNFTVGVPILDAQHNIYPYIYAKNASGTTSLKLKVSFWYNP